MTDRIEANVIEVDLRDCSIGAVSTPTPSNDHRDRHGVPFFFHDLGICIQQEPDEVVGLTSFPDEGRVVFKTDKVTKRAEPQQSD